VLGLEVAPSPSQSSVVVSLLGSPAAAVELDVFTVGGSRIRRLGRLGGATGKEQIAWDLRTDGGLRTGSGVYFIRAFGLGGRPVTRKLIVLQ
jgi:hypothetical protein